MNTTNPHADNLMSKLQIGDLKCIRSLLEKNKTVKLHKKSHPLKELYPSDQLSLPEIIQIEPIHACNLRCKMCHVGLGEKLSYKKIEVKQLLRNLDGLGPIWYDIGSTHEPTMHPDFVELAIGLTRLGGNISTVTNATLLNAKKRVGLDEANIKKLTVSFDGCTKETYESIRLRANYESTLNNIEGLVSQLNGTDTYFSISNTVQKENLDEIEQCVDFWNELNFDHINYLAMVVRKDDDRLIKSSIENKIPELELRLNNAATQVIENQLDITLSSPVFGKLIPAKRNHPDNFVSARDFHYVISDSESSLPPFAPMPFFQSGPYPGMRIDCRSPFKMARIDYYGNVQLCHKISIGNIYEKPFEDIWYGEEANAVRAYVQSEDKLCNTCEFFKFCINCSEVDYSNKDNFRSSTPIKS